MSSTVSPDASAVQTQAQATTANLLNLPEIRPFSPVSLELKMLNICKSTKLSLPWRFLFERIFECLDLRESLSLRPFVTNAHVLLRELKTCMQFNFEGRHKRFRDVYQEAGKKEFSHGFAHDPYIKQKWPTFLDILEDLMTTMLGKKEGGSEGESIWETIVSDYEMHSFISQSLNRFDQEYAQFLVESIVDKVQSLANMPDNAVDARKLSELEAFLKPFLTEMLTVRGHSITFLRTMAERLSSAENDLHASTSFKSIFLSNDRNQYLVAFKQPALETNRLDFVFHIAIGEQPPRPLMTFDKYIDSVWLQICEGDVKYPIDIGILKHDRLPYHRFELRQAADGISACLNLLVERQQQQQIKIAVLNENSQMPTMEHLQLHFLQREPGRSAELIAFPNTIDMLMDPAVMSLRPNTLFQTLQMLRIQFTEPLPQVLSRAIQLYYSGRTAASMDNSFMLIWSALECLTVEKHAKIDITKLQSKCTRTSSIGYSISSLLSPLLSLGSLGRRVFSIADKLSLLNCSCNGKGTSCVETLNEEFRSALKEFRDCRLSTSDNPQFAKRLSEQIAKMAALFLSNQGKPHDGFLRQHPSLIHQLTALRYQLDMCNGSYDYREGSEVELNENSIKNFRALFTKSRELTDLQLLRLHAIRSRIVHGGHLPDENLLRHAWLALEWYTGKTLTAALLFLRDASKISGKKYNSDSQFSEDFEGRVRIEFTDLLKKLESLQKNAKSNHPSKNGSNGTERDESKSSKLTVSMSKFCAEIALPVCF